MEKGEYNLSIDFRHEFKPITMSINIQSDTILSFELIERLISPSNLNTTISDNRDSVILSWDYFLTKMAESNMVIASQKNKSRAIKSFNVFLDDMSTSIEENNIEMRFAFNIEEYFTKPTGSYYTFGVQSVFTTGKSEIETLTVIPPVSIASENPANNIILYPNPSSDYVIIKNISNAQIEIYNSSGALMKEEEYFNNNPLQLSDIAIGKYIIKINSKKGVFYKNLIITR